MESQEPLQRHPTLNEAELRCVEYLGEKGSDEEKKARLIERWDRAEEAGAPRVGYPWDAANPYMQLNARGLTNQQLCRLPEETLDKLEQAENERAGAAQGAA